jgi:hypothetical protein
MEEGKCNTCSSDYGKEDRGWLINYDPSKNSEQAVERCCPEDQIRPRYLIIKWKKKVLFL